jgi:hypothetical protein
VRATGDHRSSRNVEGKSLTGWTPANTVFLQCPRESLERFASVLGHRFDEPRQAHFADVPGMGHAPVESEAQEPRISLRKVRSPRNERLRVDGVMFVVSKATGHAELGPQTPEKICDASI